MANKIYQTDFLNLLDSEIQEKNEIEYFILRLVATGRKKIVLCEKSVMYVGKYGSHINQNVYDFLEKLDINFIVINRNPQSFFSSPILHILNRIYYDNGQYVSR